LRNVYSQFCPLETGCKDEHGSKGAVEVFESPPGPCCGEGKYYLR
jgi:hypothetical protein